MDNNQLTYLNITEVAEFIESGEVSPGELTDTVLDRIQRIDPWLKSYALVTEDEARVAAREAEREIRSGTYRGPLHGVPIAVKDLCATKSIPTRGGTPVLVDNVPDYDAEAVARLRAAGAILLGKLNMTEGATVGYHPDFDVPVNPWGEDRWSGASSSGSGVATVAGLCYGSLGSDTGGSIRFPSAACGIVGLKPTWGRVSRHGILPLAESLDHIGPMTRSTADAAVMLQAIGGSDPKDPTTLTEPLGDLTGQIGEDITGVRVGYDDHYARTGCDPEQADAAAAAVEVLDNLGAEIVEVKMPAVEHYLTGWWTICSAEAVAAHAETYPSRREDYGAWLRDWLDIGSRVTGAEYAQANNLRAACNGLIRRIFDEIDVLVCPSSPGPAHKITMEAMYGGLQDDRESFTAMLRFTAPFDFNDSPTLSVPAGLSSDGLPLSVQFVGHRLGERLLCRIGHTYEQATSWHTLPPQLERFDSDIASGRR